MRDYPSIACRGKEGKQVPPIVSGGDDPKKNNSYTLWPGGSKSYEYDDDGKF